MTDQKLLAYIKQKISEGEAKDTIKMTLMKAGWDESEIEEGFKEASQIILTPPVSGQPEKIIVNEQVSPNTNYSHKFSKKIIFSVLAVVFVLLLIGGGVYFYFTKAGLSAISPYTDKNLFSGLLSATSNIHSSSYLVSASLVMTERDADALPFTTKISNEAERKQQYQRDTKRAQDVSGLLGQLANRKQGYPAALDSLVGRNDHAYYGNAIIDPLTQQKYNYAMTENGNNFFLAVTFETDSAISQIKKSYKFDGATTIVSDKIVTFTKASYPYFYISSTLPKPFLVSLSDMMAYVPPETNVSFSASAQSDFTNKDFADWKFNADATGDFGDLTYKFNVDALRKDSIYYLRINNMPSFFFSYIGFEKGQWIKIDPSKMSSGGYSPVSSLPAAEKSYKEHRQEIADALKRIITIADSESLFTFKSAPHKETVGGAALYRYDLLVNKEAIVPFYKKFVEESNKTSISNSYPLLTDNGYLQYLQSPEFSEVFDYYQKNTSLTLWVDSQGYPAIVNYSMRIVPPDSVTQLKDKQANLIFKLTLSDINKPVKIDAPTDAKNFEDAFPFNNDPTIKGNLSTILTNGAIYYDTHKNYANFCASTGYTQPATAVTSTGGSPMCKVNIANGAFCACASLKSATGDVFCVDSTGVKKQTTNTCANACTVAGKCVY